MIPYDIWRIRNGAVVHDGTTDTTLGVLGPRDIGAIAKGAVVLMYRGGSKAQQAQLLKAAQDYALRGFQPTAASSGPPAEPEGRELGDGDEVPANGCDGDDEGPARAANDDCDEVEGDGESEGTDNIEAPRQRGRPRTVRVAPKAVRSVYRPPPEAPPSTLFAPAAMPCRDCGETSGHTSRCPRNPDAEIHVEPIYAPRPAAVSYQRSVRVEEPLREEPTESPASPPEPPAALADEAEPPRPPLAELDLGAALPAPEVDPQPTAPSPVAASLPPRRRPRPERAPGAGVAAARGREPHPKARAARGKPSAPSIEQQRLQLVTTTTQRILAIFRRASAELARAIRRGAR